MFDAYNVIAVTPDGVYYSVDGSYDVSYYSFREEKGENLCTLDTEMAQELSLVTYERDGVYLAFRGIERLFRVSGEQKQWEEITEGALLEALHTLGRGYVQTDGTYIYCGEERIPAEN